MSSLPVTPTLDPEPAVPSPTSHDEDPDRGWRYITRTLPDGRESWETVPLTEADFLDPQEGDVMPQRPVHAQVIRDLHNMLEAHYRQDPTYSVFHDLKMEWGIPGLERPSPDIAVVPGVRNPGAIEGMFYVQQEGTRPVLVIEVVSPGYVDADTNPAKKGRIYATAGVQEFVILDSEGYSGTPVAGYRLERGRRYQAIPLDADGLVPCISLNLTIGLDGEQAVVVDRSTGQRLLTHTEQIARAEAAEARAAEAEVRAATEAQARASAETALDRLQAELQRLRRISGEEG